MTKIKEWLVEASELIAWIKNSNEKKLDEEQANVILGYMEGHDYSLAVSDDNKLIRVDIASDNYESDPYSIRDAINIVSEWNAELIDYYHRRWELEDDINEAKYLKLKLSALKNDECILDKLYA